MNAKEDKKLRYGKIYSNITKNLNIENAHKIFKDIEHQVSVENTNTITSTSDHSRDSAMLKEDVKTKETKETEETKEIKIESVGYHFHDKRPTTIAPHTARIISQPSQNGGSPLNRIRVTTT